MIKTNIHKKENNMETKTLYHKASVVGLINLLTEPTNSPVCVSTHDSAQLFWRDVCLVLEVSEKNILVENENDIDSHSVTAHDEARIRFDSKEELLSCVKYIIVDGKILRTIKAAKFNSPDTVDGGLANKFFEGNYDSAQKLAIKEFYTENTITTLGAAKKIKKDWNRKFLNM